jgi:Restriction endonuclease
MTGAQGNQELFAKLFRDESLTPQKIYDAMDDVPFEFFVKYVFERAGYSVEHTGYQHGPGLDLKVSLGSNGARRLHSGVQVKHFQPGGARVTTPQIVSLRGGIATGE